MFNELELSVLFECRTSKHNKTLHSNLNKVISKRLINPDATLYRGITSEEINVVSSPELFVPFELTRVTSFTEDESTARQFASIEYQTNTLLRLNNSTAFCYHEAMRKAALEVPLEFFNTASGEPEAAMLRREEYLEMIDSELEWMLPLDHKLIVIDSGYIDDFYVLDCIQAA